MKKNLLKKVALLLAVTLTMTAVGCQRRGNTKGSEAGQMVDPGKAGMSTDAKGQNETFKPADYGIDAKDEYVYEFLGLKFKLPENIKTEIKNKNLNMSDDQSPIDKELKYAMLTFSKMTEEQKNAEVNKMGDEFEKWQEEL